MAGALGATALLLLAFVGIALSGTGFSGPEPSFVGESFAEADSAAGPAAVLALPIQVLAMAGFGILSGEFSTGQTFFGNFTGGFTVYAVPLTLTIVLVAALVASGWFVERRWPANRPSERWLRSGVSGLVLAVAFLLVTSLAAVRSSTSGGMAITIDAASISLLFGTLVLGTIATLLGRARCADGRYFGPGIGFRFPPLLLRSAGLFFLHTVVFSCIAVPVLIILVGIQSGWAAVFTSPLWAVNAAVGAFGLGHLSGVITQLSGEGFFRDATIELQNGPGPNYIFDLVPAWGSVLTVLAALLMTVVVSIVWKLRREAAGVDLANPATWLILPLVYAAGGLLLMLLSYSSIGAGMSVLGGLGGSVYLAPWTFLVLALWGLAVEGSARFLAPVLVQILPAGLVRRMAPRRNDGPHTDGGQPAGAPVDQGEAPATATMSLAPPPVAGNPPGASQPMDPRRKRRAWAIIGAIAGAVVLLVAALIAVNVVNTSAYGPDEEVSAYLDALESGDASTALAVAQPNVANAKRMLLTDKVFKAADHRIDGYTITDTDINGDTAVITADVRQDGRRTEMQFQAQKTGSSNVFFDKWTLKQAPLGTLRVMAGWPVQSLKINGVPVELPEPDAGYVWQLPAFPGEYVVELDGKRKYLTLGQETAMLAIDGQLTSTVELELKPSDALIREAKDAARTHLNQCLASTSLEPEDCPNQVFAFSYGDTGPRNVDWTLTEEPEFEVARDWAGGWSLQTVEPGEASATYEVNQSFDPEEKDWESETDSTSITFTGDISIDDGDLKMEFSRF
ncbi:MAG TPA: hypothetical protein VFI97_04465 [Arthrobacter sp.]|nr:hypothetical protein [Arthrobacter sp.]